MSTDYYPKETAAYNTRAEKAGSTAKILDRVAKAAYNNNRAYEGCARCVLHALIIHLNILTNDTAIKAVMKTSTALSAGVARKGETCGALLGALQALDFDGYVDTMSSASRVFDKFKNKFGTVKCSEIQEKLFGRSINFFNSDEAEWWYEHNGLDKCPGVCAVAAGYAAEEILIQRGDT